MDEINIRDFFLKIVNSVSIVILWAMIVIGLGIYKHWLIPNNGWGYPQFIFYVFSIASLLLVIKRLIKLWKK